MMLPTREPTEASTRPSALSKPAHTDPLAWTRRVLIVDDEPATRCVCRILLESEGLACDEAGNGLQAWQALQEQRYDLVLLDLDLPLLTGAELLQRLRAEPLGAHLKIILISGRASRTELLDLQRAGADDCLSKPFTPDVLADRIQRVLSANGVAGPGGR